MSIQVECKIRTKPDDNTPGDIITISSHFNEPERVIIRRVKDGVVEDLVFHSGELLTAIENARNTAW